MEIVRKPVPIKSEMVMGPALTEVNTGKFPQIHYAKVVPKGKGILIGDKEIIFNDKMSTFLTNGKNC